MNKKIIKVNDDRYMILGTVSVDSGYNTEEFIIEKSDKGKWIVNIENYTIEDDSNPTFIKYTVYKNYGRPNEIKKVEVLDLSKLKQKITLDILNYYN